MMNKKGHSLLLLLVAVVMARRNAKVLQTY
jgi:hypothetical protein